ncbi:Crp/Fnr family transcriptional regulator [Pelomonas puraquae]|uniref:Crp/Fnr family transcriptional regulator n=2 Tax=Roseateles puraquae TaxID=431059 RepID=A0A254N9U9_9BURK|nr:Crp/Fnr family transcriptional regulator [Roseateles puraquae]OWR01903.1 Crp/Fnr family transcriptional regulator [Roseateles puraquae]
MRAHLRERRLRPGERLFSRGDTPDGLYGLAQGLVRFTGVNEAGQEAVLVVLNPPQWFGEIALFDDEPRTHDAWAESAVTLWHVSQAELAALLAEQPAWWRHFGRLLTQKIRASFTAVEDLVLLAPRARLARRLALMATGFGTLDGQSLRVLRVSQEQLASMLALSRQTVNQALKELEAAGALRRARGAVEVLDLDALRRDATPG